MSTLINSTELREISLGRYAEKSTGTLAASTVALFTVAGGEVLVTSIYGRVTTAITVANSYKLQHNPTTGTTNDLVAATDIGTTDTPAGDILTFDGVRASSIVRGGGGANLGNANGIVLQAGQVESVSGGTDGVILWVVTWVPLTAGATLVAA